MEKVGSVIRKVQTIIGIVVVVAAIAIGAYMFLVPKTLKDTKENFQFTIPAKYNFEKNTSIDEEEYSYDLAVYDSKTSIYIYASRYKLSDEIFEDLAKEDRDSYIDTVTNLSEVKKIEVKDHESYAYSFEYNDNDDKPYYIEINLVKTEKAIYRIEIECTTASKEDYTIDFEKILTTFKELK